MAKEIMDRYAFTNALIGWLGNDEVYQDLLNLSVDEYTNLVEDPSEEFEEQLAKQLSAFTVEELNAFAMKHEINVIVE